MSTHRSNTASDWFRGGETQDWPKRIGDSLRTMFDAIDTGGEAAYDYRRLSTKGVQPQQASEAVFQKHFGKR